MTHAQAHLSKLGHNSTASLPISAGGPSYSESTTALPKYRASWPANPAGFATYGQDHQQGYQHFADSTRSSRSSSIKRPSTSGSDDRKRFSEPNTLAPVNMSMDMSPNTYPIGAEDRKASMPNFNQDRYAAPQYQRELYQRDGQNQSYYMPGNAVPISTAPPMSFNSQAEAQPPITPYRAISQYQKAPMNQQSGQEDWSSYFQPGAHDSMMFNGTGN